MIEKNVVKKDLLIFLLLPFTPSYIYSSHVLIMRLIGKLTPKSWESHVKS